MPGINPLVIVHKLNVDLSHKLVKQRMRTFAPKRNQAIADEVKKLLQAGFIREVYYLEWLANVCASQEVQWQMEDVCRLHLLEKGLPERQFSTTSDGFPSRFHIRTRAPQFHGCLLGIQPDTYGRGRPGEEILHYRTRFVLLQDDAIQLEECQGHILETGQQDVSESKRPKCRSLR